MSEHHQQHCTTAPFLCLSEADFHERLVQFFRPFVSTEPVDWDCLPKSVTHFARLFEFEEFVDLYFDYIFGLFEDFRITNREVIQSTLLKYCRFKLHYYDHVLSDPDELLFPVDVRRQDDRIFLCNNIRAPRSLEQLLSWPFMYRNLSVVKQILRYAAPVIIEWRDFRKYIIYVACSFSWKDPFLQNVDCCHWDHINMEGSRRFKLILMALDFLLQVRIGNSKDAINGLRLLFQALPDCHVTQFEILGFLRSRLTLWPSESMDTYIRNFRAIMELCYPECSQLLQPRSLKHLARCEVRRCLGRAHTLPHGVWSLGLPRELEDYVLLQTRKDQFRPDSRTLSSEKVFVLGPVPEIQSQETLGLGRS